MDSVNYHIIFDCIEELKQQYNKPIIGFISDKQSSIRKCMKTFYPDIPHQYCTYHFSTNLWNHLEKYANNIHKNLQKTVKSMYINTVDVDVKIYDPIKDEKVSLKKLCSPLAKEIKSTLKNKDDKFNQLKGLVGFEKLSEYYKGFKNSVEKIPIEDRFAKILKTAVHKIGTELANVKPIYDYAMEGFKMFKTAHKLLWKDKCRQSMKIDELDSVFNVIWIRCQELNPKFQLKDRKSFLPNNHTPYWRILGEWTRLWESYKPGLFKYYNFPVPIKSNVEMEQKFSAEKQRFRSQSGRGHVGQMIQSRGQYVLRLQYCAEEEIDFKKIIANSKVHLKYLQEILQRNIHESCLNYRIQPNMINIYIQLLQRMYGVD